MSDPMGLSKMEFFKRFTMKQIAERHIGIFRRRVSGGMDYRGSAFPPYSDKYFIKKQESGRLTPGRAGFGGHWFIWSGHTLMNLKLGQFGKHVYNLVFSGEAADIVRANADRKKKRDIISGIPKKEHDFIRGEFTKDVAKQIKKLKDVRL